MDSSFDWVLRADDALVRDHVVAGKNMLPGLAYPDLMLRIAHRKGLRPADHCLERLAIIHPLGIDAGEQAQLRMSFSRIDHGWHLAVSGFTRNARGETSEEKVFAKVDLREEQVELSKRIDIPGLKSLSRERIDMNDIYALAGGNGLHHAGLMRATGEMHVLPTGGLIELAVDLRHAGGPRDGSGEVLCHPTLMDGAAMASGGLRHKDRRQEQEGLFVPLACDSFRLSRPLQSRCFALMELASFKSVNDIRKLDIDFFDAQGVQIAALEGLTAKLVRAVPAPLRIAGDAAAIQPMLCEIFARYLKKNGAQIDPDAGFYEMGFKSADLLRLLSDIESRLDLKLPPSLLFEYTTVRELSRFLQEEAGRSPRTGPAASAGRAPAAAAPTFSQIVGTPSIREREPNPLALLPRLIDRLASEPARTLPVELRGVQLDYAVPADPLSARASLREATSCPPRRDAIQLRPLLEQATQGKVAVRAERLESLSQACGAFMPVAIERLRIFKPLAGAAYLISKQRRSLSSYQSFDAFLVGEDGEVVAEAVDILLSGPAPVATDRANTGPVQFDPLPGNRTDIAVIGMSGRYPGARDLEAFWRNLRDGIDCIGEIPASRWDWHCYYNDEASSMEGAGLHPMAPRHKSKWGGFIDGVDEFDADFFGIPAQEAALLDPQERLFLQQAWGAMEDAGYTRESLAKAGRRCTHPAAPDDGRSGNVTSNDVSVYVGVMYAEYQLNAASAQSAPISLHPGTIANRVSYCLNLNGPSMAVDALCASSLASIHLACEDLRTGRSKLAIAGGVNLTLHPNKYAHLSAAGLLSASNACESLGRGGEGYIPSEGVGALLLKRLSDAEADGDQILGVIRGSALNHGGKSGGFSIPNLKQQRAVIERALAAAEVNARDVSYVEGHATGTVLGDPIEVTALTQAFRRDTSHVGFCLLGSVKSNIGHAESAAGIAGVTKVLLQLRHGLVAPSLHAEAANPHIDFSTSPFVVNRKLSDWPRPVLEDANGQQREVPRIAGISSFGATGTNAHLIIQEYRPTFNDESWLPVERAGRPLIVPLSARDDARLREVAQRLRVHVEQWRAADEADEKMVAARSYAHLMNIAFTMQVGREAMSARRAVITHSLEDLWEQLHALEQGKEQEDGGLRRESSSDRELREIANRWLRGESVDWATLATVHSDYRPRRISLPTYPFARQRHWVGLSPPSAAPQPGVSPAADERAAGLIEHVPAEDSIESMLRRAVSRQLRCRPEEISAQASFFELGLNSLGIVAVSQELEQIFHLPIPPTALFEHDGIAALARHLAAHPQVPSLDRNVLAILENLKSGVLTPDQAHELIGEEL